MTAVISTEAVLAPWCVTPEQTFLEKTRDWMTHPDVMPRRNSDESEFGEMKPFLSTGRWEPRYTGGKQGHEGVSKSSRQVGGAVGRVGTTSRFLFLKGTRLSLINVFKCLKDETSYVLSEGDYRILFITVKLKQLWYFLKKQQLTGRFENPNDLYLNQCPLSLRESHTLCVGRRWPSLTPMSVRQTRWTTQWWDLKSPSQQAGLSSNSKLLIEIKIVLSGWGGRNFLCQQRDRGQGTLMQGGEGPLLAC